jgi:hypothetical protein
MLVLSLLLLWAAPIVAQAPTLQPIWSLAVDGGGPIVASAWSADEACVAVATNTTVHVVDHNGRKARRLP